MLGILWWIIVCYGILVIHPEVQKLSRIHPGVLPGCRGTHSTDGQQLANPSANLMEKASLLRQTLGYRTARGKHTAVFERPH